MSEEEGPMIQQNFLEETHEEWKLEEDPVKETQ